MKKIKSIIYIILFVFTQQLVAQSFQTGSYFTSGDAINTIDVLLRDDNVIKATFNTSRGNYNYFFKPLDKNKGSYESTKGNFVLTDKKGVLVLLELDKNNLIKHTVALASSKKALREGKKKLGIKNSVFTKLNNNKAKSTKEYFLKHPTSDFHKQNVGKIVFFSKKPEIGKEDKTLIKNSFKVGDEIWAVAYLPSAFNSNRYFKRLTNSFYDAYGKTHYWITVGVDKNDKDRLPKENEIVNQCTVKSLYKKDIEKNYVVFQLVPATMETSVMDKKGSVFLLKRMGNRLQSKKHKIRVALTDGKMEQNEEIIAGYFNYDATTGTETLLEMSKKIASKALDEKKIPTAVRKDRNIERDMLMQVKLWGSKNNWSDVDFKRAIITLDWTVLKDRYGNIEGKYIEGDVLYKSNEGCGYRNFGFIKKYLGGGRYDSFLKQHTVGATAPLSCKKVK
ncbi:hypothetical protein [Tenacibaculum aiptasiae]|uniref:hypothetical protein n=1 Tax=Tenacibaculum aiptasiae TaxID=426481 RepID=UPI00232F44C8|nr:hypothetical protein [Tenacibaculum aiptasiae]